MPRHIFVRMHDMLSCGAQPVNLTETDSGGDDLRSGQTFSLTVTGLGPPTEPTGEYTVGFSGSINGQSVWGNSCGGRGYFVFE